MQVIAVVILAALGVALSCTSVRRELQVRAISPDERLELVISWLRLPPDGRIEVTLHTKEGAIDLQRPQGDWIPGPVEVSWQPDRRSVAVLVCNDIGSPLLFQHNIQANSGGGVTASTKDQLRSNLRKRYGFSSDALILYQGDPIEWACRSVDAAGKFRLLIGSKRVLPNLPD